MSSTIDFFVSYTHLDTNWAKGIADWLKAAGYSVIIQEDDFVGGSNFAVEMHDALRRCERTIAVLSPNYLLSKYATAEWIATFNQDPLGKERRLIPVRIEECTPGGLLGSIRYIDVVGLRPDEAQSYFLREIGKIVGNTATVVEPTERWTDSVKKSVVKPRAGNSRGKNGKSIEQSITGDNNVQVVGNYIRTDRHYERPVVQPGPTHISAEQAYRIQQLVEKLARSEGGGEKAYQKWWTLLKRRYKVPSYHVIPLEQGEEVISWLQQRVGQLRNKLRKNDTETWKKDSYGSINARAKQLGMSKTDIYSLAYEHLKLKAPIDSLKKLSDAQLKKLYSVIIKMK